MSETLKISVIGAGSMGSGIAQVAAQAGLEVCLIDTTDEALEYAGKSYVKIFDRLVEKGKLSREEADKVLGRIDLTTDMSLVDGSSMVVEAIVERLDVKQKVFAQLESLVDEDCYLASNTSSLSIASIAAACKHPERVIGLHFFNPAPLMPLVEIVPSVSTDENVKETIKSWMLAWGKIPVIAKDTPGFIVNRVARPYYGEALRIYDEGIADFATIDWAMKELGGFRMGPFELMDYIGNDVNYAVTESVFQSFYNDPRYKPSFTQKRLSEIGWLGRKSGKGYYDYSEGSQDPKPNTDSVHGTAILNRVLVMLFNEAIDAVFWQVASAEDIELAMTKGVNYPKGLLAWASEYGLSQVLTDMDALYDEYREDRYRASALLRRMVSEGRNSI